MGRIIAKLAENCQSGIFANGKEVVIGNWVDDLAKTSSTPVKTIYNWWTAFTKDTNRDITPKKAGDVERKAFAAEVGRIIQKLQENSKGGGNSNLEKGWLVELAANSGITQTTAYNWWTAFTKETGLDMTPKQAGDAERKAFAAEVCRRHTRCIRRPAGYSESLSSRRRQ